MSRTGACCRKECPSASTPHMQTANSHCLRGSLDDRPSCIRCGTVRGQWERSAYRQIQSAPESTLRYEGHSSHESMESRAEYRVTIELTSRKDCLARANLLQLGKQS